MNVFELNDLKFIPDIFYDYTKDIKESAIPLVIDNGSYQCKVGWANNADPLLIFRNLIAKPRKDRSKKDGEIPVTPPIQIGNDIVNIEAMRFQLKTQFDRNVVTHYHNQEQIYDYIFKHLGINNEGSVPHPIVLTECFVNPNYCRQLMSELLFECYNIPSVCNGVDSLFSFYNNEIGLNGLIISCGYQATHIAPILNGNLISNKVRRINLGGYHMINYLHRLLQLKYPTHATSITLSRIEWLLHNHCSIAYNYLDDLKKWAKLEFYDHNIKKIQLPYTLQNITLTAEQKFEKKRELAKRFADMNARRREEKLVEDESNLRRLVNARDLYNEDGNEDIFQFSLKEFQISDYNELDKFIQNETLKIERVKQKIALSDKQINLQFPFEEKSIPQPPTDTPIQVWIDQIKQTRLILLERRHCRRQRKQDLAKRRTAAAQERMRIISQLARKESRKEKFGDDFGKRDADWDVYKTISRENGDSDSETENEKLMEYEEILRHHDPTFEEPNIIQGDAAELHQLHVGIEAIRAPELLFQPSMIGSCEAGLAETIDFVLKLFSYDKQLILANNVFLTGGCSKFPGLEQRLSRELLEMRPFQTPHKINLAKNAVLDSWYGARNFANSSENIKYFITNKDYEEMGGEYLKEHYASNKYFRTPAPIVQDINEL